MTVGPTMHAEEGEYFAVDIGGTNYRVIYVQLSQRKGEVVHAHCSPAVSPPPPSCMPGRPLWHAAAPSRMGLSAHSPCGVCKGPF